MRERRTGPPEGAVKPPGSAMMRRIVEGSLNFRFLVVAAAVALMVLGVATAQRTPLDVFPEFAPPQVEIQTECLGLSTADVESLVTVPLEQALNGVQKLDTMRSTSVPQLSDIKLIFKPGTDLLHARQLVQERLDTVGRSLPSWAAPPVMLAPLSATARVLKIGMWSDSQSIEDMSLLAYWTIRPRLLQVAGVANVAIWNERQPSMQVQVDPAKMAAHNVTLEQVMTTTADSLDSGLLKFSNGSVVGSGGFVDTTNQRLDVQHKLAITKPEDLAKVRLENPAAVTGPTTPAGSAGRGAEAAPGGAPDTARGPGAGGTPAANGAPALRLGDVATVVQDHQPIIGDAVINGGTGLLLVVEKLPWGNTLQVTKGIEDVLKQLEPTLPGTHFTTSIFRPATYISESIHNLSEALVLGFLLVFVILVLFLFEGRVAVISLITIPLSLAATLLVLHLGHATINTMTLAGMIIALGALVDDAIIDVENVLRRLRQNRKEGGTKSKASIIINASLEVRGPIVYATLIIVAAALPVFLLHGLTAAFFKPLALTYTLAIVASMVVALTVTPALAFLLLGAKSMQRKESPVVRWLQRWYTGGLKRIVARPLWAYTAFAAVVLLGVGVVPQLGQSLFPDFKQRDFLIHFVSMPGTSPTQVERVTLALSDTLREIPGVRVFGAHIGRARQGEEVAGINFSEAWISIDPKVDYDKTLAEIHETVDGYPGLYRDVQVYLNERIEEVLTGSKEAVVVRVYGDDLNTLRAKADQINEIIGDVKGTIDQHVDLSMNVPQLQVEVDLAKAAKYGLKPGDVRRAAATLVAGEEVGDVFRDGRVMGVVVWSVPGTRDNASSIANLPIDTPSGTKVRLGEVAKVDMLPNPNAVTREGGSRYLDVATNVEGRDLASVVREIQQRMTGVEFPHGFHAEMLGEYQEQQAAQRSLYTTAIIAAIAILFLLQASFRSWRLALLLFLTLPVALVGGALAIYLAGGIVTIGALVGFFTVFGICARNGILLINHCQHLEDSEGMSFGPELVLRGARERLSPILMTSLATGLALVPLVLLGDRPGHEIDYPLAVVILGGLVVSTLLTLFVVPSLYLRFGRSRAKDRRTPGPSSGLAEMAGPQPAT